MKTTLFSIVLFVLFVVPAHSLDWEMKSLNKFPTGSEKAVVQYFTNNSYKVVASVYCELTELWKPAMFEWDGKYWTTLTQGIPTTDHTEVWTWNTQTNSLGEFVKEKLEAFLEEEREYILAEYNSSETGMNFLVYVFTTDKVGVHIRYLTSLNPFGLVSPADGESAMSIPSSAYDINFIKPGDFGDFDYFPIVIEGAQNISIVATNEDGTTEVFDYLIDQPRLPPEQTSGVRINLGEDFFYVPYSLVTSGKDGVITVHYPLAEYPTVDYDLRTGEILSPPPGGELRLKIVRTNIDKREGLHIYLLGNPTNKRLHLMEKTTVDTWFVYPLCEIENFNGFASMKLADMEYIPLGPSSVAPGRNKYYWVQE